MTNSIFTQEELRTINKIKTADDWNIEGVKFHNDKSEYRKALHCFEEALKCNPNQGNALRNIGVAYELGYGVTKEMSKAKDYFIKSLQSGYKEAGDRLWNIDLNEHAKTSAAQWSDLADNYYYGRNGRPVDYGRALHCYRQVLAANPNHQYANYSVGWMYEMGQSVSIDLTQAKSSYQHAAGLGHKIAKQRLIQIEMKLSKNNTSADAWNSLGVKYYNGSDRKVDYENAVYCFEQSLSCNANQGNALRNIGMAYEYGNGVEKNFDKAEEYYNKARAQHYDDAVKRLCNLELKKLGLSTTAAENWFQLGLKYDNKENGRTQDREKESVCYKNAIELSDEKHVGALYCLALMYSNGEDKVLGQDYAKARAYFEKAAKLGHKESKELIEEMDNAVNRLWAIGISLTEIVAAIGIGSVNPFLAAAFLGMGFNSGLNAYKSNGKTFSAKKYLLDSFTGFVTAAIVPAGVDKVLNPGLASSVAKGIVGNAAETYIKNGKSMTAKELGKSLVFNTTTGVLSQTTSGLLEGFGQSTIDSNLYTGSESLMKMTKAGMGTLNGVVTSGVGKVTDNCLNGRHACEGLGEALATGGLHAGLHSHIQGTNKSSEVRDNKNQMDTAVNNRDTFINGVLGSQPSTNPTASRSTFSGTNFGRYTNVSSALRPPINAPSGIMSARFNGDVKSKVQQLREMTTNNGNNQNTKIYEVEGKQVTEKEARKALEEGKTVTVKENAKDNKGKQYTVPKETLDQVNNTTKNYETSLSEDRTLRKHQSEEAGIVSSIAQKGGNSQSIPKTKPEPDLTMLSKLSEAIKANNCEAILLQLQNGLQLQSTAENTNLVFELALKNKHAAILNHLLDNQFINLTSWLQTQYSGGTNSQSQFLKQHSDYLLALCLKSQDKLAFLLLVNGDITPVSNLLSKYHQNPEEKASDELVEQCIISAICWGHLSTLQTADNKNIDLKSIHDTQRHHLLELAVLHGQKDNVTWLLQHGFEANWSLVNTAAEKGHVTVFETLSEAMTSQLGTQATTSHVVSAPVTQPQQVNQAKASTTLKKAATVNTALPHFSVFNDTKKLRKQAAMNDIVVGQLMQHAQHYGFTKCHYVEGDGNCFFYAFLDQLIDKGLLNKAQLASTIGNKLQQVTNLRNLIITYAQTHQHEITAFLPSFEYETFDNFIQQIPVQYTYATNIEMTILSKLFNVNLAIINPDRSITRIDCASAQHALYVGFEDHQNDRSHYWSLRGTPNIDLVNDVQPALKVN